PSGRNGSRGKGNPWVGRRKSILEAVRRAHTSLHVCPKRQRAVQDRVFPLLQRPRAETEQHTSVTYPIVVGPPNTVGSCQLCCLAGPRNCQMRYTNISVLRNAVKPECGPKLVNS